MFSVTMESRRKSCYRRRIFHQFLRPASSKQVKGVKSVADENHSEAWLAVDRLMEAYGDSLLRLCALYLKDAALAQDAVQDTFLKAYQAWHGYRGEAAEKTWLTAIAVNVCRDYLRGAWHKRQNRWVDLDALAERPAEFRFPDNTVLNEVMRLPRKYREVILLRYYEAMKLKEMSAVLKLPEGTIRSRLKRANGLLRSRLKEWYDEES